MTESELAEQLTKAAGEIRKAFVTCGECGWYPRSCCQLSARVLGLYLIQELKLGPVEIICNGTRYLTDQLDEWDRPREQSHAWLEVGGFIIDITAEQFDDCDTQVIVTKDRSFHGQFQGQTRHAEDDILGSNDFVKEKYGKLLRLIKGWQATQS